MINLDKLLTDSIIGKTFSTLSDALSIYWLVFEAENLAPTTPTTRLELLELQTFQDLSCLTGLHLSRQYTRMNDEVQRKETAQV